MHTPLTLATLGRHVAGATLALVATLAQAQATAQTSSPSTASAHAPQADSKLAQALNAPAAPDRRWSFSWGVNFETYSRSDIHFHGDNHDFTLYNVSAEDKQKEITLDTLSSTYLNPGRITIPQTNARLAYQWSDTSAVALNLDHMKYVVTPGQVVRIEGTVKGQDRSGLLTLSPTEFGHYEHTDGLNILSVEVEQLTPVAWFGPQVAARLVNLAGAGVVIPKSNVTLTIADRSRNDHFHLAGYSLGLGSGLEVDFWERYFVRSSIKVGYVNLPDVLTSAKGDKASQHFTYTEWVLAAGVRF